MSQGGKNKTKKGYYEIIKISFLNVLKDKEVERKNKNLNILRFNNWDMIISTTLTIQFCNRSFNKQLLSTYHRLDTRGMRNKSSDI